MGFEGVMDLCILYGIGKRGGWDDVVEGGGGEEEDRTGGRGFYTLWEFVNISCVKEGRGEDGINGWAWYGLGLFFSLMVW